MGNSKRSNGVSNVNGNEICGLGLCGNGKSEKKWVCPRGSLRSVHPCDPCDSSEEGDSSLTVAFRDDGLRHEKLKFIDDDDELNSKLRLDDFESYEHDEKNRGWSRYGSSKRALRRHCLRFSCCSCFYRIFRSFCKNAIFFAAILSIFGILALVIHQTFTWPSKYELSNYIKLGLRYREKNALAFPLINAHSHNDYEQIVPLKLALAAGFCSIEADVHLAHNELRIGHLLPTNRKLLDEYVLPLIDLTKADPERFGPVNPIAIKTGICEQSVLFIDMKTDSIETWKALETLLRNASIDAGFEVFQRYDTHGTPLPEPKAALHQSPIRVIMSGISIEAMDSLAAEMSRVPVHRTQIDGRLKGEDIAGNEMVHKYLGMVSSKWESRLTKEVLARLASKTRAVSLKLRFWEAPEDDETRRMLLENNCILSTNRIDDLESFLTDGLET